MPINWLAPGTALGGRTHSQLHADDAIPSKTGDDAIDSAKRGVSNGFNGSNIESRRVTYEINERNKVQDRSIKLEQVELSHVVSDVSSIEGGMFIHDMDEFERGRDRSFVERGMDPPDQASNNGGVAKERRGGSSAQSRANSDSSRGGSNQSRTGASTNSSSTHLHSNRIFTSDAANNYYGAMQELRVIKETDGDHRGKEDGKVDTNAQTNAQKKSLEELVTEALAVVKTPQEAAQYLMEQDDDGQGGNKMELFAAILARQKEQHRQETAARSALMKNDASVPVNSFEFPPIVTQASSLTILTEMAVPRGAKNVASDDPPIGEYPSPVNSPEQDTLGYPENKDGATAAGGGAGGKMGQLWGKLRLPPDAEFADGSKQQPTSNTNTVGGKKTISHPIWVNGEQVMIQAPATFGSKQKKDQPRKKEQPSNIDKVRSMSPMVLLRKKSGSVKEAGENPAEKNQASEESIKEKKEDESTAGSSTSRDSRVILIPPTYANNPAKEESKSTTNSNNVESKGLIRTASKLRNKIKPSSKDTPVVSPVATTRKAPQDPPEVTQTEKDARECIESAKAAAQSDKVPLERKGSKLSKFTKKVQKKSPAKAVLPPRIPSREVVQQVQQQIITSSDDEGSVECSVKVNETAHSDAAVEGSGAQQKRIGTGSPVITTADDDSVEISVFCDMPVEMANASDASPKSSPVAAVAPEQKKKSRMAQAKDKYQRKTGQANKSPGNRSPVKFTSDDGGVAFLEENKEDEEQGDDGNESIRKKDRLKKILDYRKKASPTPKKNLPQETLDEWLVSVAKEKVTEEEKRLQEAKDTHAELLSLLEEEKKQSKKQETGSNEFFEDTDEKERNKKAEKMLDALGIPKGIKTKKARDVELKSKVGELRNLLKEVESMNNEESTGERDRSHPVKQIRFDPNSSESNDADADLSLPPELEKTKKIKIWEEDTELIEEDVANCLVDGLMCSDGIEMDVPADEDNDTFVDKTTVDNMEGETAPGSKFICGVDPRQLKNDITHEIKDSVRDLKGSIKNSIRNIFGACDITRDGGVDKLMGNMSRANDQLFGREDPSSKGKSQKQNYWGPTSRRSSAPTSPNPNPNQYSSDNTTSQKKSNPAAKKMSSILQKIRADEKEASEGKIEQKQEEAPKYSQPIGGEEKKKMYLEKLRAVSSKHL